MQITHPSTYKFPKTFQPFKAFWRMPTVTVARLTLESYFRSGWMWAEFVLVLLCFAALFFPFRVYVAGFYGTSTLALGAIAILGTAIMVRQATSARTYLVLSRLSSRASYSRGLMLATALLRVPLLVLMLLLVLITGQLIDPAAGPLLIGIIGLLPNCIVVAVLTVMLSSPIATRLKRIIFLAWLALVLFAQSPVFWLPEVVMSVLRFASLPLLPTSLTTIPAHLSTQSQTV